MKEIIHKRDNVDFKFLKEFRELINKHKDKKFVVVCGGGSTARKYILALRTANLFHYPVDAANMELVVPGTNVKLIGVNGLNGTDYLVGLSMSNLYLGTDLLNEQDRFELFYAKEADEMRFVVEFKMGVQVAFTDQVVFWKKAS
jgi:rhodanese-related sulfurtransferase